MGVLAMNVTSIVVVHDHANLVDGDRWVVDRSHRITRGFGLVGANARARVGVFLYLLDIHLGRREEAFVTCLSG
jgi:hypothetical protein